MGEESTVWMDIVYDVKKDNYVITGNVKRDKRAEVLGEFLRTQMGQGSDKRKPNEKEKYTINLKLDLSYDTFNVSDDIGNKSLRDGILIDALSRLERNLIA